MQPTPFQQIVKHLTDDRTPRVWSLLVTVFGELAQDAGSRISGAVLRALSAQIGIKPEAMRVALHRLRKDGWIDSERTGRTSVYFLTPWGRAQSVAASPQIYAVDAPAAHAWLVMCNPAQPLQAEDITGVWLSSHVLLTAEVPLAPEVYSSALSPDTRLPVWMTDKVCDDATVAMTTMLAQALETLEDRLNATPDLDRLEIAALRVLLVHSWRRIVLKTPSLPDYVFPDDWRGALCRERVSALLTRYPKPQLDALEAAIAAPLTP